MVKEIDNLMGRKAAPVQQRANDLQAKVIEKDFMEVTTLSVDSKLTEIVPPCLPFELAFHMGTRPITRHSGTHKLCFNGEFKKNVAKTILRTAFSSFDELYKLLEETELRYVQIETVKKSLDRVNDDMTTDSSSRRGHIEHAKHDVVNRYLLKKAERKMPSFTTKSDHTVMAFTHYSPWAAIRRSKPFVAVGGHTDQKYNFTSLQGNHTYLMLRVALKMPYWVKTIQY